MEEASIIILPFNTRAAAEAEYAALNLHNNRIRLERLPDDPPVPVEEFIQNMQSLPAFIDVRAWVGRLATEGEVIAMGNLVIINTDENKHLAQFDISVQPAYRRGGLGRELLSRIAEVVQREERRLLVTETHSRIQAGEAFMLRIGAQKVLEAHTNQLRISDLDRGLLDDWLRQGAGNLDEFEMGFWDGAYPEDALEGAVELFELTNQQPFGELEIEEMHITPEQLRQMEANQLARGHQRWTYYIRERGTGKYAGYTQTIWNPNRPELLEQLMTGVFPRYRNKGLGRWLKAAMLDKVLKDRPQVKYVRTGNADMNAAMLKINNELGFKPYMADALWQVELDKVLEYVKL
jgi:RimJ/RimL family protein N-acetyltransferase